MAKAMQISRGAVTSWRKKAESLQAKVKRATEKADTVIETAVHTMEVAGGAFGFGVWAGRSDDGKVPEVMGLSADLLAGLACHAAAFMGVGGNMSSHLHGFGNGALAHFAANAGRAVGEKWKTTGSLMP